MVKIKSVYDFKRALFSKSAHPLTHPVRRDWPVIVIVDVLDAINNSLSGYEFIRFLDVNLEAGGERQATQNV
jgi:hypothetical protein